MKKIGIVVAIEIGSVLKKYGNPKETIVTPGYDTFVYENEDYTLYVVSGGAGEIGASAATQFLITNFHVHLIINFGVVGGLTPEMTKCQACIVKKVIHYHYTTDNWLNLRPGQYPGRDSQYFYLDKNLIELAHSIDENIPLVTCASADRFVGPFEDRVQLHDLYDADICDMEAAGVVITANRNNIPVLSIKTVSDFLNGGEDQFFVLFQKASDKCFEVVDKLIKALKF